MIRRLVYDTDAPDGGDDIVLAAKLMGAIPHPAYYPDAASLGNYLTDPSLSVFIDDETKQMAVVTLVPKRRQVRCTYGLPIPAKITIGSDGKPIVSLKTTPAATAALVRLREVVLAAEKDMLANHPEAADYRYVGNFQITNRDGTTITSDGGRALCLGWQVYYPTSLVGPDGKGNFSLWAPFKDVVL